MTNTELREIDAQVHREVMGAVWDETRCRVCGWPIVPEGEQGCWASNCSMRPLPERRADELPHYATNIAAAWQMVERMRSNGYEFAVIADDRPDMPGYAAEFDRNNSNIGETTYLHGPRSPSAPLAICLAALKAVSTKET